MLPATTFAESSFVMVVASGVTTDSNPSIGGSSASLSSFTKSFSDAILLFPVFVSAPRRDLGGSRSSANPRYGVKDRPRLARRTQRTTSHRKLPRHGVERL